jgi:hypothetical protein
MADYRLSAEHRKTGRLQDDVALLFQAGGRDVAQVIDREKMEPMAGFDATTSAPFSKANA